MPDRSPRVRAFLWGAVAVLAVIVVVLSIIGFSLRQRVVGLEELQRRETLATRTADVASCYGAARSRPRLIVILRLLAQTAQRDPMGLAAVNSFIMDYEAATPTLAECDKRARRAGFDPADFPPVNRGANGNGR